MNQPIEIDALPLEILVKILKQVGLADLVKLKAVCKLWNELISVEVKMASIVVDTTGFWYVRRHKPLDIRQMAVCPMNLFLRNTKKPILSRLKYLRLNSAIPENDFSSINSLNELLRLDINYQLWDYLKVSLPKLETLKLSDIRRAFVRLDCPKLKKLICEESEGGHLEMAHPESIVELTTAMCDWKIFSFKNLEILKCNEDLHTLDRQALAMFPKLKRVYYEHSLKRLSNWYSGFTRVRQILECFIANRKALQRTNLQFYLSGLRLDDNLDNIDFGIRQEDGTIKLMSNEYFYIRNYDRLQADPLEFVREMNYTNLMSVTNQLPTNYFDKFPKVEMITANKRVNSREHFLWYLQNLRSKICYLKFKNTGLNQTFYDSLPAFCSPCEIQIDESQEELNYNFLSGFGDLKRTVITQELSLKSAKTLLDAHQNFDLCGVEFRFKGKHMWVHCNTYQKMTNFVIYIDGNTAHESECLTEIFEWIKSNVFV